jgi:small-conductance mechanosensitive channel
MEDLSIFDMTVPETSAGLSVWWLGLAVILVVAQFALRQFAKKQENSTWIKAVRATLLPFMVIVILLLARSTAELIPEDTLRRLANQTISVLLIASVAWWILAATRAVKLRMLRRFDMTVEDNFHARQVHTRFAVLYRIFSFFVVILAIAFALMTFEAVRAVGTSLLAGAGVTGIILGFAAQKTLGAVFAGIQIAITQPIKIDDAVVIEGEWGWIEEITLTYVVVRIWDMRRMIVPITYFVDNPVQNWTRREAEIIGTVVMYADYTVELAPLRAELTRLLEAHPLWNKKVNVLQVIDTTPSTVQLRALMSARNSPKAWDLRCDIREGLIRYLQQHQPEALPRTRIELPRQCEAEVIPQSA